MATGFNILGLVFGYVSVALGPLGLAEALIVFGLILLQVRRFPERSAAYLMGTSIVPLIVLASIVSHMRACPASDALSTAAQCYAPITVPAVIAYAIAGIVGAVWLGIALRRLYRQSSPSG